MTDLKRAARKITFVLFLIQSMASAGFIAAATLNPIAGEELSHRAAWAGVPSATYLLGAALSAYVWGVINERFGRRLGLASGLLLGVIGSGMAFWAIGAASFPVFLAAMALMGFANAAVQLGRFAAAEVNLPHARGRAISNVVIGGTFGSVFGPMLIGPAGAWALSVGSTELGGAYAISLLLFAVGVGVALAGLRPDPRDLGRAVAAQFPESESTAGPLRSIGEILRVPAARVAMLAMILGQMVMVLVMVITSLHMKNHHHGFGDISVVISAHTFGMFAFSIISGRLADKHGRGPIILFGSAALIVACLAATLSPDVLPLGIALFLLGLGWNFCFVGGTTLLADQLSVQERARTQGFNDLLVGSASAIGSLGSGIIFAAVGYEIMALVSAALAVVPFVATLVWFQSQGKAVQSVIQA